ncbi:hypothetical protein D3C71_1521090 [compost metagenome]
MPSQNTGMELPIKLTKRAIWSVSLLWRTAAATPSGTPISTPRMVASVANSSVAGKTRLMSSHTGLLVRIEVPRLPCSTSRTYIANCCHSGLSSPMASLAAL